MKNLTKWREAVLTEVDLSPVGENGNFIAGSKVNSTEAPKERFYPRKLGKDISKLPLTVDLLNGFLQPLVLKLNQGKDLKANTADHYELKNLLQMINR